MPPQMVAIRQRRARQIPLTGGKGASLAWLVSLGLPVPPAQVLTTAAFHAQLARLGVDRAKSHCGSPDDLAQLAERLAGEPLPRGIERILSRSLRQLGPAIAVRSSAACEDSEIAWQLQRTHAGMRTLRVCYGL